VLEDAFRLTSLLGFRAAGILAVSNVFGRQKQSAECLFMTWQHGAAQLYIEPTAGDRVIDGRARKRQVAIEKRRQFVNLGLQHVVAEDRGPSNVTLRPRGKPLLAEILDKRLGNEKQAFDPIRTLARWWSHDVATAQMAPDFGWTIGHCFGFTGFLLPRSSLREVRLDHGEA
jgi:hypothetical protein